MAGESPARSSDSISPARSTDTAPRRSPRRALLLVVGALIVCALGVAWSRGWLGGASEPPLQGEFTVAVRQVGRAKDSLRIDEPGALPVRAEGWLSLEVHFNQPACAYMVWFDTEGRVVPLYPWNNEELDVTDINEPPPVRGASKIVMSPISIGSGWQFGKKSGLEAVLLLARRRPLPAGTRLGGLLTPLPHANARQPNEAVILGLDPGATGISTILAQNRGAEAEAQAADEPLRAMMRRLHEQFELVRAVRFAHE